MATTVFTDDGNGLTLSGVVLDNGDIKVKTGKKVYFDNDLDTYFTCAADDILDLYIAGSKDFIFSTNKLSVEVGSYIQGGSSRAAYLVPLIASDNQPQALSGAGAITLTEYRTNWTTTGADAGTLADGDTIGQLKKIILIVDGGDGTLTPTTLANGTTITFADAGDYAVLMWTSSGWYDIELGNEADGATAPVLA
jgi:hypothetical protein